MSIASNEIIAVLIGSAVIVIVAVLTWAVSINSKLSSIETAINGLNSWLREIAEGTKQLNERVGQHGEQLAEHSIRLDILEK